MNLSAAIELQSEGRSIQAKGLKQDNRFQPVHAGAHAHFTKVGYIHTGNKIRGGVTTSNYFKTKGGNSRHVAVQADGSYMKTSRTAKGEKRNKGKMDAKGMKCGGPGSGRHKEAGKFQVGKKDTLPSGGSRTFYKSPSGTQVSVSEQGKSKSGDMQYHVGHRFPGVGSGTDHLGDAKSAAKVLSDKFGITHKF